MKAAAPSGTEDGMETMDKKDEINEPGAAETPEMQKAADTAEATGAGEPAGEADASAPAAEPAGEDDKRAGKLKAELKKLRAELAAESKTRADADARVAEATEKYTRLYAEYDNFRRRSAKEKEDTYAAATADALTQLLPLLDNLTRAAAFTEGEKVIEGVHMILGSLPEVLSKMNITAFGAKGDPFDPNIHNAVMQVQDEALAEGTVAEVLQCGYRFGDRVIRHAMVSVVC